MILKKDMFNTKNYVFLRNTICVGTKLIFILITYNKILWHICFYNVLKFMHDFINVKLIYFVLILNDGYNKSINDNNITQYNNYIIIIYASDVIASRKWSFIGWKQYLPFTNKFDIITNTV